MPTDTENALLREEVYRLKRIAASQCLQKYAPLQAAQLCVVIQRLEDRLFRTVLAGSAVGHG